ncbi:hypothetical protein [Microvirga guangxiensis]|uniref:Uncharacterized protein n=1 Tax=Microvirga guangxiensis TaxID=549386 RepID=A0A1G5HMC1_9HYPH|nr:hypothetical protein [Microvirga guangxiensis]SCY64854.1 hypothetical protein SAMN02927923_01819 [Microvirga guangxiensis]
MDLMDAGWLFVELGVEPPGACDGGVATGPSRSGERATDEWL